MPNYDFAVAAVASVPIQTLDASGNPVAPPTGDTFTVASSDAAALGVAVGTCLPARSRANRRPSSAAHLHPDSRHHRHAHRCRQPHGRHADSRPRCRPADHGLPRHFRSGDNPADPSGVMPPLPFKNPWMQALYAALYSWGLSVFAIVSTAVGSDGRWADHGGFTIGRFVTFANHASFGCVIGLIFQIGPYARAKQGSRQRPAARRHRQSRTSH